MLWDEVFVASRKSDSVYNSAHLSDNELDFRVEPYIIPYIYARWIIYIFIYQVDKKVMAERQGGPSTADAF